ncbi:MAG: HigA family addiction module antitoxin [Acidobacteriota bacterium]|nr:HigA family addiction module antitoxin [Acidobacteriota bacterium]
MLNNRKRRPTHPGEVLREDVLPELGLSQGDFAATLGVSRRTVNEILQEKRPVTVDMAHRLARALNTSPDVWLGLQQSFDLWETMQENKSVYARIKPLSKAA